ncbi:MAG: hypothetical protein ACREDP_21125, partial [Bradyrhizobium sp.]
QEEGLKDRPCAVVLAVSDAEGREEVVVLPITHTPPASPSHALEIPAATKRRLGLDDERSWIVLTEANRFIWPGPDLRPSRRGDPSSVLYGLLSRDFFYAVREKFLAAARAKRATMIPRTE